MVALAWDPVRYDYLSEHRLFLISWSIWDYSEFAEVRIVSFFVGFRPSSFLQHLLRHPPAQRGHRFQDWTIQGHSAVIHG